MITCRTSLLLLAIGPIEFKALFAGLDSRSHDLPRDLSLD